MPHEINLNDLSFDAVIPSAILLNRNIEPACVKFYAFVRGLTRAHGYCFATNAYLAQLMDSDESSVRRWLSSLKEEGFIEIETEKNGIHWQRRIFIAGGLKESLRKLKNKHPPRSKISTPPLKNEHHIEDSSKEDILNESSSLPSSLKEEPKKDADENLRLAFKKTGKLDEGQVERAIVYYKANKEKIDEKTPNYSHYVATIVIKGDDLKQLQNQSVIEERKAYAHKYQAWGAAGGFEATATGVQWLSGNISRFIAYNANDEFWERAGLGFPKAA
jgi:hypothetical protein